MVNTPMIPDHLVPWGFIICRQSQEDDTPQRVFAFLGNSIRSSHENVAIVILDLEVDLVDYPQVAEAILDFLSTSLRLHGVTIQCSGMGVALVSFASSLDRPIALGALHCMEPYWLTFVPHDAGPNLRHLQMDHTCWLMLVNFPLDGINEHCITSANSSFANLIHWHQSRTLAHQIILVHVHSSAHIPFSIIVATGDEPYAPCCLVACYVLTESQLPLPIDPKSIPDNGRSPHPLPVAPLRWLGNGPSAHERVGSSGQL
jgi:hypothetical protein